MSQNSLERPLVVEGFTIEDAYVSDTYEITKPDFPGVVSIHYPIPEIYPDGAPLWHFSWPTDRTPEGVITAFKQYAEHLAGNVEYKAQGYVPDEEHQLRLVTLDADDREQLFDGKGHGFTWLHAESIGTSMSWLGSIMHRPYDAILISTSHDFTESYVADAITATARTDQVEILLGNLSSLQQVFAEVAFANPATA